MTNREGHSFSRFVVITATAFFLALTFAVAQNTTYQQDAGWQAPPQAVARANPLANRPEAAAGGRKLFQRECAECHGKTGEGQKKAADLQLPAVQSQSDGTLFWKITNGNAGRGMPSFSGLPEMQRWQIVLYLRQLHGSTATK